MDKLIQMREYLKLVKGHELSKYGEDEEAILFCIDCLHEMAEENDAMAEKFNGAADTLYSLLSDACARPAMFSPETFYTGGGIWLSAMWVDNIHYVTIDGEDRFDDVGDEERFLYFYDATEDDDPLEYGTFCMIEQKNLAELSEEERKWYDMLLEDLKKNAY